MIRWLIYWLWGPHDCNKHGHRYFARYDDILDPRLGANQIQGMMENGFIRGDIHKARAKMYIRDICRYCGDNIERIEGLNAMEIIAHQANRIV